MLQHAHNPVDWHEWGPEALDKAKQEDKPIFPEHRVCRPVTGVTSWSTRASRTRRSRKCLNDGFVSIKVDREERPDIDELYMAYTQATTGHGGWPMSVWLTPEGAPFFAGTYFPPENFKQLLTRIRTMWQEDRAQVTGRSQQARDYFSQWASPDTPAAGVMPARRCGSNRPAP